MRGFFRRLMSRVNGRPDDRSRRFRPLPSHPVEVQILGPDSLDVLLARDVSASGIGVRVPHRFEGCDIDSPVELVITFPGQRPFVAVGRIRHETHQPEDSAFFGVQFMQLSRQHQERLRSYLGSGLAEPVDRKPRLTATRSG